MENSKFKDFKEKCKGSKSSSTGCLYGMGAIGAMVYFIGSATSFGAGVLGVLKSIVWPAIMVYHVFSNLGL